MIAQYFQRRTASLMQWWRAPVRGRDRWLGFMVGLMAGFWIGLFAGFDLLDTPAPIPAFLPWVLGGIGIGAAAGLIFPKHVSVLLFPFMAMGGGISG